MLTVTCYAIPSNLLCLRHQQYYQYSHRVVPWSGHVKRGCLFLTSMGQQDQCRGKHIDDLPYFYRAIFGHILSFKVNDMDHSLKDKESKNYLI